MSFPVTNDPDSDTLCSVVEHVFMPPKLPQKDPGEQVERQTNVALCSSLIEAAQDFLQTLPSSEYPLWKHMIRMMELIHCAAITPFQEGDLQQALSDMDLGDVFSMHIRAQNAALIVRRLATADFVQFEVFEVSPQNSAIMTAKGKLLRSYPGPAIQVPADTFMDQCFLRELSSFLVQMDVDNLDSTPTTKKAGSVVYEVRESVHPKYISELLVGILRGYGRPSDVYRITKRIGDEILWDRALKPWRRSPLWLILRVALQSSLRANNCYKLFMLFFHARLLRCCLHRDFPSELLYAMRAKMARRLSKLGPTVSHDVFEFVHDTANETEALLSKRWTEFQATGSFGPTLQFESLDCVNDTHISLNKSYNYFTKMLRSAPRGLSHKPFNPSHSPRLKDIHDFTLFTNARLAKAFSKDMYLAIADFELSVEKGLEFWAAASMDNVDAADVIASWTQRYFAAAKDLYGVNAEDNSIMILTIMDLWVTLDKLTIRQCPLLKQYSPEIPSEFLHPLLVHRSSALRRALRIEEHLCRRHSEALGRPSVFSNSFGESSFAVKYFRTSRNLQRLYEEITTHAQQERAKKRVELESLNEKSKSLLAEASTLCHEQALNRWGYEDHNASCRKCQLQHQASALTICIHEWPLPSSIVHAQLTVFELSPPRAFSAWRDITYMILRDIGLSLLLDSPDRPEVLLGLFSGLRSWADQGHRVTIGSTTKSFSGQSHYKVAKIPAQESSVLLNNGLSFRLLDRVRGSWTIGSFTDSSIVKQCTPPIPVTSPYSRLHPFVSGTEHTPNDIIVAQSDCPEEINVHEFVAFSGLRSCPRLQWLNIARELASPSLSFCREEVHTLVTQAAWQVGPLSDGVREWHVDLSIFSFGKALLRELASLLRRVRANWLEEVTVRTIALICGRLLASTTDLNISRQACTLLRKARNSAYLWIHDLGAKLDSTHDEISRSGLRRQLCMLAATCLSTFDVSSEHLPAVLASDEDFSIAIHCAFIVHDNTPPSLPDDDVIYLSRILSRHRRLLHYLEPILNHTLPGVLGKVKLLRSGAYDQALSRMWLGHRPSISSSWYALPEPNSRWIFCKAGAQLVHYNLLTGQLLIGGKPLGKLPQEIVEHSTYASVLGSRVLNVAPADIPGMDFMTRSTVSGYQILFSWDKNDLVLQIRRPGESHILQLIPRSTLLDDFPRHFIDEYVHWLDLRSGEVEFRPADSPWTPRSLNWRLYVQDPGVHPHHMLRKLSADSVPIQLVDIRSRTFSVVSRLLSPLASRDDIIATRTAQTLDVSVPRLRMSFFVNTNSELESRSIPGYVLDKIQSCGTMFGLKNKLVLCPISNTSEQSLQPRRVIIPQGEIAFMKQGDFTDVSINTDAEKHVRWHEYTIDADLGCLRSNASLISKLYQCYLHALTSHCLPDPLLCHTGTEEALYILRSAACRSFQRLGFQEAELLESICNLTPTRFFYPPHLKSMATVKWNSLPALSQHHDFCRTVCHILDHTRALEVLYDQPTTFFTPAPDQLLLNRAALRNKLYYPLDLQTSEQTSSFDNVAYKSRDVSDDRTKEHLAFQTSWSIWNSQPSLNNRWPKLWDMMMNSWGSLSLASNGISLRYGRYWLEFDAKQDWLAIYSLCNQPVNGTGRNLRIELSFSLSAAAYGKSTNADIVPFLTIFALDERCHIVPPLDPSYSLSDGLAPEISHLKDLVSTSALPINLTPAHTLKVEGKNGKKEKKVRKRRKAEYDSAIRKESSTVAMSILQKWPDYRAVGFCEQWFDKPACERRIEEYIQSIAQNNRLRQHVIQLQNILQHHENVSVPTSVPYVSLSSPQFIQKKNRPSRAPSCAIHDLLVFRTNVPAPSTVTEGFPRGTTPPATAIKGGAPSADSDSLEILIEEFRRSGQPLEQLFGEELNESYRELLRNGASQPTRGAVPSHKLLRLHHDECSHRKDKIFSEISAALAPSRDVEKTSEVSGLWPRITPRSILRQLAHDHISTVPDQWKSVIMCYALSFIQYQHSIRLLDLSSKERYEELLREIEAIRSDVLAESTSDWLLIQIEANLLARPIQVAVAHEMISPCSERNMSLQLNMGEGKSSVIVPLVTSALADGSNLVRIVTLKPLSNQMFQLLVSRLSDLVNRAIFYVPFSRSLHMSTSLVKTISGLYRRCIAEGGVLVVQPEHMLSQKLMHIDTLLASHTRSIVRKLSALQDWVTNVSRDVLDESDEILHVRYQLVYTAGEQMPVDDHPNRWTTIQQVFSRLQAHAIKLHARFPRMFEIDTTLRGFPIIRILDSAIFQEISSPIIDDALGGGLSNLPLGILPSPIREVVRRFMANREVSDEDWDSICAHCVGTTLLKGILLLRGLLMDNDGILGYVLKERRWRVDYGLHPSRTLLAVPYLAKDVPSLRAEFAHPDVAITLTCLSYYYGGLTKDKMLLCFDLLARLDNPEMEYDHWVELDQDQGLPASLRQFNGVNTEDETQVDEYLVPLFSRNKRVVDFYLSQVVFPRAAREFPSKLSTSAWDLVEEKNSVTTGFSGTNDNRHLLPTSITQEDPEFVLCTNALVLQYLLRPENDHYECTVGDNGERESATDFLQRLVKQDPEIRVLLDVGAQILELQNEFLARAWLSLRPDVSAAIFFDDSDHLTVVTHDGTVEPLISSTFNRRLENCIIYLDDAHTRGTDLKLPQGMRAAVTLGPKVTKDKLVQGCMRMRQLGKGHSVMFFAPGEVDSRIQSLIPGGTASGNRVRVLDILRWAIHETCRDIRHHLPYWVQQGLDHHKRFTAYKEHRLNRELGTLQDAWLQPEFRTLEQMYSVAPGAEISLEIDPSLSERMERLGVTKLVDVRMAEEQEREVDHEIEQERQVERPPKLKPARHIVRPVIREFVKTGQLPRSSKFVKSLLAPIDMAEALDSTTGWSPSPLATEDFIITNLHSSGDSLTDYLRPVNWILSSGSGKDSIVIAISPYEANELLPIIRKSKKVRLHIYAPRVTSSMRSFSDLTFHTIPDSPTEQWTAPAHIRTELNLFAGQLYFDSREDYERVCVLLALAMAHPGAGFVEVDGFVPSKYRTGGNSPFKTSKVSILKTLIGLRRKGIGYHRTHLGQVLNANPLSEETLSVMPP